MRLLVDLAVVLVMYSTVTTTVSGYSRAKEGKCPGVPPNVNCGRKLFSSETVPCFAQDVECPGTEKCCDDGCDGYECVPAVDLPKLPVVGPCAFEAPTVPSDQTCEPKNVTYCSKLGCKQCCTHTSSCSPIPGIYIERAECEKQLCKEKSCPRQGQICVMDKYHRATCECRQECPTGSHGDKVCGSDDVTYENECSMNMTACVLGDYITVKHSGACDQQNPLEVCYLPKDKGYGPNHTVRYYFDKDKGVCDAFLYRGKNGNKNNFRGYKECEEHCSKAVKDVCALPMIVGSCRAALPRWHFNTTGGKCQQFTYGGCHGNGNNFGTKYECQAQCSLERNVCNLPKDPGVCLGYFPRWYFNSDTRKCEQFIYGGCRGNKNKFMTEKECKIACGGGASTGIDLTFVPTPRCEDRNKYVCRSVKKCIPAAQVCNGLDNCGDNSDEENCDRPKNPCDSILCEYHAVCVTTKNGSAICECPKMCRTDRNPVCGSDNQTYPNLCTMQVQACEKQQMITKKSDGECGAKEKSKCEKERASFSARIFGAFIPRCEEDGSYSITQCHDSSGYCWCVDEDGNEIEGTLVAHKKPDCDRVRLPTAKPFDICDITTCDYGKCVNVNGNATCQCDEVCPEIFQPLCGSDNKTYPNLCVMEAQACKKRQRIEVQHDGECGQRPKSMCEIERDSIPKGKLGAFRPTCEKDGSYSQIQCHGSTGYCWCADERGVKIDGTDVLHKRPKCDKKSQTKSKCEQERDSVDPNLVGAFTVQCEEDGGYSKTQCHSSSGYCWCVDEQGKKLEGTEVRFDRPICEASKDPCKGVVCDFYAQCVALKNGSTVCDCPTVCTEEYAPVCGSNDKTYGNLCAMKVESCEKQELITKKSDGKCVSKDPCKGVVCDFYAQCVALKNGSTVCDCPTVCTREYAPVCGSNDKTYGNLCAMKVESCETQELITKKSDGKCAAPKDPCEGVVCDFYAQCVALTNGSTVCDCPTVCTREYVPVCGSNDKTYGNLCTMKVESCEEKELITKKSDGECASPTTTTEPFDICDVSLCQFGRCVNVNGNATCQCNFACPLIEKPVCGSDNKTYANLCVMEAAACEIKQEITLQYEGSCVFPPTLKPKSKCQLELEALSDPPPPGSFVPKCEKNGSYSRIQCHSSTGYCWCVDDQGTKLQETQVRFKDPKCEGVITVVMKDPCENVSCPFYGVCVALGNGGAGCECPTFCTSEYDPVCGSNEKTYGNICDMRVESCQKKELITKKSDGECVPPTTTKPFDICEVTLCEFGRCVNVNGNATCQCNKACPFIELPVCGSDNKTYANLCVMEAEACEMKQRITVQYEGRCVLPTQNPCAAVKCEFYSKCKVVDGEPKCVCDKGCTREYFPKCGSDGVTYSNPCELKRASCEQMKNITVARDGECVITPTPNPCAVVRCGFYSQCKVVDGNAKCVCDKACTEEYDPKCGSDNVTYSNLCEWRRASCEQMEEIKVVKNGTCEEVPEVLQVCSKCPATGKKQVIKSFCSPGSKFVIKGEVVDVKRHGTTKKYEISVRVGKRYKPRKQGRAILKRRTVVKITVAGQAEGCRCDNLDFKKNDLYILMGRITKKKRLVINVKDSFVQKATADALKKLLKGFRKNARNWRFCWNKNRQ